MFELILGYEKNPSSTLYETLNAKYKEWKTTKNILVLKYYFIEQFPECLEQHIKSMDTVTAMFFKTGLSPCGNR